MSTIDTPESGGEPKAESDSSSAAEPSERGQESWLDRLKVAVGLKPQGTIREEIAEALAADDTAGGFSPEERLMLANILRLREVRVDDVMVPRADIDAAEIDISLGDLFASFEKSGHSRMPVYRETLDDPVGFVHIKDLIGYAIEGARATPRDGKPSPEPAPADIDLRKVDLTRPLAKSGILRNILFVPPSMPVTALLAKMQATRMQLALVIDEYGGTDGLVSLEDVVEMIVGDIEDEHDDDGGPMIVPDGDGVFLADGRAALDDVRQAVGSQFATGEDGEDVDTLGGLVFSLLGRVPVRGELITVDGFELEILDADPRRIKKLRIRPQPAAEGEVRRRPRAPRQASSA